MEETSGATAVPQRARRGIKLPRLALVLFKIDNTSQIYQTSDLVKNSDNVMEIDNIVTIKCNNEIC